MLKRQGITKAFATPHFYADNISVDDFCRNRSNSFASLTEATPNGLPEIFLGAEVKYYQGISRLKNINMLCAGRSDLLLLEMPFGHWTEYTLKELNEMTSMGSFKVVLAHIERYLPYQSRHIVAELLRQGVLIQANAEFFISLKSRHKAFTMLSKGQIHFIGSDCHGIVHRPPQIGEAYSLIQRKFGDEFCADMNSYIYSLLF